MQIDAFAQKYSDMHGLPQQAKFLLSGTPISSQKQTEQQLHDLEDIVLAIRKLREGLVASKRMDALTVRSKWPCSHSV